MTIGNFIKITGLADQFDKDEMDLELTEEECNEVLKTVMEEWIDNCLSEVEKEYAKESNLHLNYQYDKKFDVFANNVIMRYEASAL